MKSFLLIMVVAIFSFAATPSWASMDQKCLSQCASAGMPSTTCMAQCTYGVSAVKTQPPVAAGGNHNVFDAPVPSSGLVLPVEPVKTKIPHKDYACMQGCAKAGWQYQLCEKRCVKRDCGAGSQQCKDLTGTAFNPFGQQ